MKKFIDLETGYMHFENGAIVKENDTLEYVKGLNLSSDEIMNDMRNGVVWYTIKGIPFSGRYLFLTFLFRDNLLKKAEFSVFDTYPAMFPPIEVAYSADYQKKVHASNLVWFKEFVGESGVYDWGTASCHYSEVREPSADMSINYERKRLCN